MTSRRLLLTGASGFIGRRIAADLASRYEIATLGRSAGSDFVCDLSRDVPRLSGRFHAVVHAAATVHTPRADFMATNAGGTRRLLRALEASGEPLPRALVFISSVAVYGLSEGLDIDESTPLNPTGAYGESKARAEEIIADWCSDAGVALTILRPSLVAAPDAPGNLGHLITALRRRRYVSFGSGPGASKSVLALADMPRLVELAINGAGGTFNVCADTSPGFREIEERICAWGGFRRPPSLPLWALRSAARLYGGAKKIALPLTFSNARARRTLPWHPLAWDTDFIQ